tara:strand:+ start:537 stop:842 length:306 start_codon:yes stop_codon:yes gene_type:complete
MIAIVKILPYLLSFILGIGTMIGIQRATKQDIKLECPAPVVNLKCPDAVNTIDFDKIKGFKGNINLDQHYHVEMNGDSLIIKKIIDEMKLELNKIRLARCK